MKQLWKNVLAYRVVVAAAVSAVPCFLMASCAETNDDPELPRNDASTIPSPDGGGSDGDSATEPVACGGTEWCIVPTGVNPLYVLKAIWGTAKNDVWAAGSGGAIAHFDGTKWSPMPSNETTTINAIWGSGPDDVYLVGSVDAIFHTTGVHGDTATFTAVPIPGSGLDGMRINTVWGTSATDVRLGTNYYYSYFEPDGTYHQGNQFVLAQGDGGAPLWRSSTTGELSSPLVRSIWGASAQDFWVAGSQPDARGREALVFHGQVNGGKLAFSEVDSQSSTPLESIHGTSAKDIWAVGAGGAIRHITDTDTRWQVVPSPTTKTLHAVWASAPDDVWAVGDDFTIIHYDGKSFTVAAAEPQADRKPALHGIWGSGPHDIWIVGDAVALHYTGPSSSGESR